MAIATAQDLITKALQKIGVIGEGETPNANQLSDGFDALNIMLDSWSGRGLLTTALIPESFDLTAGQYSYTIGVGGNFNTDIPLSIEGAYIRDNSNQIDFPVSIVTRDIWDSYFDKVLAGNSSRPEVLFYDPGATQQAVRAGTIILYPIPDAGTSYTLFINSEKNYTDFVSLSNNIPFPPAYTKAIIYNLAIDLSPDYGRQVNQVVKEEASEAMRIIENINSRNKRIVSAVNLPGGPRRTFNILTGLSE